MICPKCGAERRGGGSLTWGPKGELDMKSHEDSHCWKCGQDYSKPCQMMDVAELRELVESIKMHDIILRAQVYIFKDALLSYCDGSPEPLKKLAGGKE